MWVLPFHAPYFIVFLERFKKLNNLLNYNVYYVSLNYILTCDKYKYPTIIYLASQLWRISTKLLRVAGRKSNKGYENSIKIFLPFVLGGKKLIMSVMKRSSRQALLEIHQNTDEWEKSKVRRRRRIVLRFLEHWSANYPNLRLMNLWSNPSFWSLACKQRGPCAKG